jgi:hypothetical protein
MNLRSSSFLGMSVSDRSIACAEISVNGGKRIVRRLGTFALGEDVSFDKPGAAGAAFLAFLRQKKFSASRAVVGIPAKWMIALEKELPPSGEEQARSMLRMQAERLAVSESGEMIFDYAGKADSSKANKVLLVGVRRQRLEQIEEMLDAAGIGIVAITSAALTLAGGTRTGDQDMPMLLLSRQGAEMVWRHDGTPRMLRHVSVMAVNSHGPVTLGPLGSELGRTLALSRGNGSTGARELLLWDGLGLTSEQVTELSDRTGVKLRSGDVLGSLGLEQSADTHSGSGPDSGDAAGATGEMYAPALSLALAGADKNLLALDFRKSRLTPRKKRKVGKQTGWIIAAAAVLILGTIGLYVNVHMQENELNRLTSDYARDEKKIQSADALIDRVNFTRGYFDTRPPFLECLREITLTYGTDKIWTTNLSLREEEKRLPTDKGPVGRKGQLQGRAANSATVVQFLQKMRGNKKFADFGRQYDSRDAGSKNGEVVFTASFVFTATE